ncbi:hypothetical protein BHM03_00054258, partial [Ensete ventricosum]
NKEIPLREEEPSSFIPNTSASSSSSSSYPRVDLDAAASMNRFFSSPELCLSQKPATAQKREPPIKESRREKKKDTNLPEEVAAAVVQMTPELPLPRAAPKVEGRCPVSETENCKD